MDVIVILHGSLRWAVAAALLVAMLVAVGAGLREQWQRALRWTNRSVMVLLTVQLALGLVLLVYRGIQIGWDIAGMQLRYEHALTMLIAVGLSHLLPRIERSSNVRYRAWRILATTAAVTVLVIAGVVRLRGMSYWIPF